MGFFGESENDKKERLRREKLFVAELAGQAHAAKTAGVKIFQVDIPLSQTKGYTVAMSGAYADSTKAQDSSSAIQAIEEEGWRLDNVGYVYRITGSVSRDKFLSSGQQEAVSGEIVGIYIFRAI